MIRTGFNLEPITTLVVDDNHHMRQIINTLLRAVYIKDIAEASDGADALDFLRSKPFDLVLADLAMQPIDGIEFTQMIRRSPDSLTPQIPIVMITGHTDRRRVELARDAGVTEFVAKPVTATALFTRIFAAVGKPRPFIRTRNFVGPDRRRRVEHVGMARRESDEPSFRPLHGT